MKFEKTNENTIKVWVTNQDLKDRDVNLLELMDNQEEVEQFFYQILEEVDVDHEFQNNDLVSFQVLPAHNGFEMIISKDDRLVSKLTEANVNFASDESKDKFEKLKEKHPAVDVFDTNNLTRVVPIEFASFEDLLSGIQAVKQPLQIHGVTVTTSLYKQDDRYYLVLHYQILPDNVAPSWDEIKVQLDAIDDQLSLFYEFGELSPVGADQLEQAATPIIQQQAVSTLTKYFQ
ncbi:adaptor protein MecA [Fructilactobacillus myrtifloralis]|uniref:Adaptor protein MecA n=1 Tax=Fructilactobacillus myrtifloralis TaxID=2940301 RepID=A0ABY5BSH9_9LACO|nr:adaptor protein MecA [Fructilactobacillus myrtifloralis]USS85541.1 adaptor protein MecA [Fructilactobacillus myrtifloralis]